jgi:tRNA-dihydrouridine synthase
MNDPASIQHAFHYTGCEAVMLARGALGNPWLFARLLGTRDDEPSTAEVLAELEWVMQRAVEHMGERRAGRYLRKFYPWYVERIGGSKALQAALQATDTIDEARAVLAALDVVTIAA